jgi:hypothetical protein
MMQRYAYLVLLAGCCMLLAGCATHAGPIAAGVAGSLAVIDQLLADGVVEPEQAYALRNGIDALAQSVDAVKQAQAGTLSTETAATTAGGLTAALIAGIRLWRGPSSLKKQPKQPIQHQAQATA